MSKPLKDEDKWADGYNEALAGVQLILQELSTSLSQKAQIAHGRNYKDMGYRLDGQRDCLKQVWNTILDELTLGKNLGNK